MKLKEMNEEQRKEYNRVQKQNQRERERQEKLLEYIPTATAYVLPEAQAKALQKYSDEILKTVQSEMAVKVVPWIVGPIAEILLGFEKNYVRTVQEGMLIGGHFPDAIGAMAVECVHKIPNLLDSPTFKTMYDKLLRAVL